MALQSFGKSALRVTKNYSKGYTHTQIKARNATCNDPWPPSGKEMHDLAQLSYNQSDFVEIMEVLDKTLNDKGKNWRHIFKSLIVLDYLLHAGSENVIVYCEENLYVIKTLREFQHVSEDDKDEGASVRQKAKDITNLLADKRHLFQERVARARMYNRMADRQSTDTESDPDSNPGFSKPRRRLPNGLEENVVRGDEDEDMRRAIEESRRSAAERHATAEDADLARAIKLSEQDEARRHKVVDQNAAALFGDAQQQPPPVPQLVGASLPVQYAVTGVRPQYTAVPLVQQLTAIQPQFPAYNPYAQQAQQEATEYMRQQQLLQPQRTAAPFPVPPPPTPQPLRPQPTALGSNNPFVASPVSPTSTRGLSSSRPRSDRPISFNLPGTYDRPGREHATSMERGREREKQREREMRSPPRTSTAVSEPPRARREAPTLADLFADRAEDGVDTFGNAGDLR
ncbi:ENTH-domain-containing protein [Epithele typhae]|uniref:ENTH-domain-containing protein n=1 Tax=Epithele typhae TaxID=378194 RepID=UPI002008287F|nr:ENTH-domain-containing protein [Epithele typhae]KAH9914896.1 ENTH-domain-containing protein [Epithele typhae]